MLTSNNRTLIFIAALLPVPGTSRFFPLYSGVGDKLPPTTDCIPSPVKQMLRILKIIEAKGLFHNIC